MIENNICLLTDSYKVTHHAFYPKNTEKLYSYLESRVGSEFNKTIFYGLQYIIKKYLEGQVITPEKVNQANSLINTHIGEDIFNYDGWMYIADELDGKLPIEIKAVEEGTPVEVGNVLMTVENTDKQCYWLPNYLESLLLQVWYPSTVATLSAEVRKLCNFYLDVTGSGKENLDFMLHDFGYRGATSTESAELCGSAHLLSFKGTDTIPALTIPENYYNDNNIYGLSVQATEHSVMASLGEEGEIKQAINVIDNAKDGILSMVIDSYNYREFLKQASTKGNELNDKIKKMGGEVVGINTDTLDDNQEGIKEAKDILKSQGASYKNLTFGSDSTVGKYAGNIIAFPTTVLVDKSGNIISEPFMGGIDDQANYEQLMNQIQSILDQK